MSLIRGILFMLPHDRSLSSKLWKTFQNYALLQGLSREATLSGDGNGMSRGIVIHIQLGPTGNMTSVVCGILWNTTRARDVIQTAWLCGILRRRGKAPTGLPAIAHGLCECLVSHRIIRG